MHFKTRGVVINTTDLTYSKWPERAAECGITTIGIHPFPEPDLQKAVDYIASDDGQRFLESCKRLGLDVEYEIHAIQHLLPRELFAKYPEMFRMNDDGVRVQEINFCPSNQDALDIIGENTLKLCSKLTSTSDRYFLWSSDNIDWCKCPKCRELSNSDQALTMENAMIRALRTQKPSAKLAHLAYASTAQPPVSVKAEDGIFLEYAPIARDHTIPFEAQSECVENIGNLKTNLEFFGAESAQILEYWLDVSLFSGWKRPAKEVPWNDEVFQADLNTYSKLGIRHVTTFACFLDADYVAVYGDRCIEQYGFGLRDF